MYARRVLSAGLNSPERVPRVLQELVAAAERMPEPTRTLWTTRFDHVYGDLSGQRAVSLEDLSALLGNLRFSDSTHDILFGLQTYFALVSDLVAAAATHASPERFLQDASRLPRSSFSAFLRRLSSGELLSSFGIRGAAAAFDFDWYVDAVDANTIATLRTFVSEVGNRWDQIAPSKQDALDPISSFYLSLVPRNLRHVLGEVYTPGWLAELLVRDSGWEPGKTLLDPFGGSGVFALAALRLARAKGVDPLEVLPDVCVIDLNPLACAAARANLILALRDRLSCSRDEVCLPVISGDTLAPALVSAQTRSAEAPRIVVDGELIPVPVAADGTFDGDQVAGALARYDIRMPRWIDPGVESIEPGKRRAVRDRRFWEQLAVLALRPADVVATNPPWVGWEYMSRPYRAYLEPAWGTYSLFTARGRAASFLKEDLSTLALITAWDRYLAPKGTAVAVVRANIMTSTLAARGLRRLSIFADDVPIRLERVRVFDGLRIFPSAQVETATWQIRKGETTTFPVDVDRMRSSGRSRPLVTDSLSAALTRLRCEEAVLERIAPDDPRSRWVIGTRPCVLASRAFGGANAYVGRTGVFTGGANAVYYVRRDAPHESGEAPFFRNETERAKRGAPAVRVQLESSIVYDVVRGRDLTRWASRPGAQLLFPHTRETRMRAIAPDDLQRRFPFAWSYLREMRPILDARKGFTRWERSFREEAFYAVQRVGDYTFAPFKVAWRYIADDFLCAVIGPDDRGRPRLANDKVMFVGVEDEDEAYYLCGVLSSDPVRWKIVAYTSGTQISANAIAPIAVLRYDANDRLHATIAKACRAGHAGLAHGDHAKASEELRRINGAVRRMWSLPEHVMHAFRRDLEQTYDSDWRSLRA